MFDRLIKSAGFPWAIRAMGFVALFAALGSFPALLSGSGILARPRKARRLFDKSALKDRLFLIFTCSTFFTFLGYIVPYFYIPTYAKDRLGLTESKALYMLVVSVAGSFFGRLGSGVVAHYLGSIVTWMLCALASGILSLCWIRIETEAGFYAFSVLWGTLSLFFFLAPSLPTIWIRVGLTCHYTGFLSAGLVTLPSAAFASICPDLSRLGTRLGMSWSCSSIASLIGAPIAGALVKTKNGQSDFLGVQLWSGVCLMFGTCWLGVLWVATTRQQKKGWRV
jgi:fucose permease